MDIFFEVSRWTGELHNAEPEKCDDVAWLIEAALPQNTLPEIRQVLEKIRGGELYSDFGFDD